MGDDLAWDTGPCASESPRVLDPGLNENWPLHYHMSCRSTADRSRPTGIIIPKMMSVLCSLFSRFRARKLKLI